MKDINILIVEDESIVAMEIESYLVKLGYRVLNSCSNSEDALKEIAKADIIIMDINIKGKLDGIELSEFIKKSHPNIEIIFLTAYMDDYNVDRAIKIDPVAYLAKPFNREELRAFLKIALNRLNKTSLVTNLNKETILFDDEFYYNQQNEMLYCHQEIIHLTKKEHQLLKLFILNKNSIVDIYTIENTIWADREVSINTVRTLIKRLKEKLKHKFIKNIPSRGYRLVIAF
ncbi:Two-component hybrid sensor and regulator [hydrothermal vent metagenome]|uniref:Two-component hybrid sensor and regulator n=1 Tax=hydrothermal vent metagenome TaxID=652676 RepID=A0A1W1CBG9_9ZZZZ